MSVNFQVAACQKALSNSLFGLCDDNNGTKAYTDTLHPPNWIATVRNDSQKEIIFTAIEQLEATIQFFTEANDITTFRHKKAFACNKQHKHFQEIDNELNRRFFRQYKVRIDVQADIIIL